MGNSLSVIRVEGDLGTRKTRGNLPLPLFGEDLRRLFVGAQRATAKRFTITSGSTVLIK